MFNKFREVEIPFPNNRNKSRNGISDDTSINLLTSDTRLYKDWLPSPGPWTAFLSYLSLAVLGPGPKHGISFQLLVEVLLFQKLEIPCLAPGPRTANER